MELWQTVLVNKWERLNNAEVMGYEVAWKAAQIADFFRNIELVTYDTFSTNVFGDYVESAIRGYICNMHADEDMHITTTLDLHNVTCNSYGLHDFDYYISEMWNDYFMFALEQGI